MPSVSSLCKHILHGAYTVCCYTMVYLSAHDCTACEVLYCMCAVYNCTLYCIILFLWYVYSVLYLVKVYCLCAYGVLYVCVQYIMCQTYDYACSKVQTNVW